MDDAIKVSVLCTAFNHEAYIRQTLEALTSQETSFPYEILVSDDASTDGTAAIIREFEERFPSLVRPFLLKENLYSRGLDVYQLYFYPNARGKYVAFCEGDDYWTDPTKLQRQVDFLEAHPEYSACVHNTMLHFCGSPEQDRPLVERTGDGDIVTADIVPGMNGAYHTSSLVAKRELLANPPDFYEVACKYNFGDYPDALWLSLHGPIRYLDRCMSVYRINSNASAWSSGVDGQYDKLRQFIVGKCEMLRAFRPHAPAEILPLVDRTILEREFELMYIEGRDREQRQPPYDEILRAQPFRYRFNNWIKCSFPWLQRIYRKRRGYE